MNPDDGSENYRCSRTEKGVSLAPSNSIAEYDFATEDILAIQVGNPSAESFLRLRRCGLACRVVR